MDGNHRRIFLPGVQARGHGYVCDLGVRSAGPPGTECIDRNIPVRLQTGFRAGHQTVADNGDSAVHIVRQQRGRQFKRLAEIAAVTMNDAVDLPDAALRLQGPFHRRVLSEHDDAGFPVAGSLQRLPGQSQRFLLGNGGGYVHHQPCGPVGTGGHQAQPDRKRIVHHQQRRGGQDHRAEEGGERIVARQPDGGDRRDQQRDADRGLEEKARQDQRDQGVAAAELVGGRVEPPQAEAEARQGAADDAVPARAEQQRADDQRQEVERQLRQRQLHAALPAVDAPEVREEDVPRAEAAEVAVKDEVRGQHRALQAARAVGQQGRDDGKDPVSHSLSPFCRMTMRMGVPSRPKTARIWFSR